MSEMMLEVNKLPVPIWHWLKADKGFLSLNLDGFKRYERKKNVEMPHGIKCCHCLSELRETADVSCPLERIETGMGRETAALMQREKVQPTVLHVLKGQKVKEPVVLIDQLEGHEAALEDYVIYAGQDSEAVFLFVSQSEMESDAVHGISCKVYVEKNAKVKLMSVQLLGSRGISFQDMGSWVQEKGSLETSCFEFGGGEVFHGCRSELLGEEASAGLQVAFLGRGRQKLDMNEVHVHKGERTTSTMKIEGMLMDESSKTLRASIDFIKGCKGAAGSENEEVLLLGPNVKNKTIPLILCGEEDVEGSHGAAIGELSEEQKFYLMTRGFSKEQAEKLLAVSRIEAVCRKIPDERVREMVHAYTKEVIADAESL